MKARLVISLVAALVGGFAGLALVSKEGDPSAVLAEFERKLDAAFQPRPIFSASATPTPTRSFKTYTVAAPDGRVLEIQLDRSPTEDDLESIFARVSADGRLTEAPAGFTATLGKVTQTAPGWGDLELLWRSLTWSNEQAAKAKAMLRFSSNPAESEAYTWERRFSLAARPWQIEEPRKLLAKRAGFALGGAAAGFLLAFIALVLLVWSWRFVLARIREVSDAIRGK